MICNNCGTQNDDSSKFCIGCGSDLTAQAPQNPYETAQAPQAPQNPYETAQTPPTYQAPVDPYQPPMQTPYQQPVQSPYGAPVVPGKGLAIAAMILGIVSLALFCLWYLAIPCGIVGLVLGAIAHNKAKAVGMKSGMATAGIVCSAIALGIALLFIICTFACAGCVASEYYRAEEMFDELVFKNLF